MDLHGYPQLSSVDLHTLLSSHSIHHWLVHSILWGKTLVNFRIITIGDGKKRLNRSSNQIMPENHRIPSMTSMLLWHCWKFDQIVWCNQGWRWCIDDLDFKTGIGLKAGACADQLAITKHDRELHVAEEPYSALQIMRKITRSFMITHVHTFAWMNQHTWRGLYNYCVHVALCSWYDFSMSLLCENSPCQQLEQCMRSYTYVSVQRHAETPQGRHLGDISNMFMHFIRSALQQWIGCKYSVLFLGFFGNELRSARNACTVWRLTHP